MQRVAKFYKVSYEQFQKDWLHTFPDTQLQAIHEIYERITLPKRATKGSAGYDFYAPIDFELRASESKKLPTGIRVQMQTGWVMQLFPRSSLGFQYRLQFDNTVGIIDEDYFYSENEGHIFAKLTNDTHEEKTMLIKAQSAIFQGLFLPYGICEDDDTEGIRNGGFGSTNVTAGE